MADRLQSLLSWAVQEGRHRSDLQRQLLQEVLALRQATGTGCCGSGGTGGEAAADAAAPPAVAAGQPPPARAGGSPGPVVRGGLTTSGITFALVEELPVGRTRRSPPADGWQGDGGLVVRQP